MQVEIENFQSLGKVSIEVSGLTVLVGPSDRGKSALVRAIEGALFNRPGSQFVRLGQKFAKVVLTGLPDTSGSLHTVEWVKGSSKNTYTVDGEVFSKVGQRTPPAVERFGYRDVWIGDKALKNGSYIRPQVAGQFDPLFLLTQPGSFIADVLGAVSRHGTLVGAQDLAASDLRSIKQRAGVRAADLGEQRQKLASLAGVPALAVQVTALVARSGEVESLRRRVHTVRELVARRLRLLPLMSARVVAVPDIGPCVRSPWAELKVLVATRQRYLRVSTCTISQRRPGTLWEDYQRLKEARQWAARRGWLATLAQRVLPAHPVVSVDLDRLQQLRAVTAQRRRYLSLSMHAVRAVRPELVVKLDAWYAKASKLSRAVEVRNSLLGQVQASGAAAASARTEREVAIGARDAALKAARICPVCERPTDV